jgi:hypothetical protein
VTEISFILEILGQERSPSQTRRMKMLEKEKAVNDRVAVASLGIASVKVEGTITKVFDAGKPYVSYEVEWDDGQYPNERWGSDDLELPEGVTETYED